MYRGQQWTVVGQVTLAVGFMLFISCLHWTGVLPFSRTNFPPNLSDGERMTYAFCCLAFSIVPLCMAIMAVGNRRFNNIDTLGAQPTAPVNPKHQDFLVCQRNLQNTLEQTVLHIIVVLALASTLEVDQLFVIPGLVFFFVVGRATFFAGYLYSENKLYRGFGFGLTFLPSVAGLAYTLFVISLRAYFY